MQFAYQILIHTPVWVWPLLAYLVWMGIKAMRPRSTTVQRSPSPNQPVAATPAITPEATITPAPTASGGNPPPPSSKADSSNGVSPPETLTTDNPINAPMTLTPETAPPPQQ